MTQAIAVGERSTSSTPGGTGPAKSGATIAKVRAASPVVRVPGDANTSVQADRMGMRK